MKLTGLLCIFTLGMVAGAGLRAEGNGSAAGFAMRADQLFHQGEYRQAAHLWERAVLLDPTNADYRDGLGRAYERQAESASFPAALTIKARNSFVRALELQPYHVAALEDLIELHQQPVGLCEGDLDEASMLIDRLAMVDAAAAERARDYRVDAQLEAARPGQKALCGPIKFSRVFTRPFTVQSPSTPPEIKAQTVESTPFLSAALQ